MKLHQILAIALALSVLMALFGLVGVAYGLETPKTMFELSGNLTSVLAPATALSWLIGKVARAML